VSRSRRMHIKPTVAILARAIVLALACMALAALYRDSFSDPAPEPTATQTPTPISPTPATTQAPLFTPTPPPTATLRAPTVTPTPTPTPVLKRGVGINIKGLNYDDDSLAKAVDLRTEWLKIYDHPPPERLPFKVLYRVNLPRPDEDWDEWGHYRFLDAQLYADRIDAYEIGNEPNLIEEWGSNPDPAAYAGLLRIAYQQIKAADPDALVVSAGLAPVNARDDPAHLNDLDFLRGMYQHGAAAHFDVLGLHPFGFASAPQTPVDGQMCVWTLTEEGMPERVCQPVEGFCFRRAEQARAIMEEHGDGDRPVWATEFGWIIRPPGCCLTQSDWPVRIWQAVSERQQARYILGAIDYAERHWPWMEVMFVWNLDYSRYSGPTDEMCPACDTMGWYSILNPDGSPRLAYEMLKARR
jgi:hypothetical protein